MMSSIKIPKTPTLATWRDGKGGWKAAMAGPDPFGSIPQMVKIRGRDWWKRYGLIGRGATRKAAIEDLESWQRASAFVAEIY
jgi:hypothetical protein